MSALVALSPSIVITESKRISFIVSIDSDIGLIKNLFIGVVLSPIMSLDESTRDSRVVERVVEQVDETNRTFRVKVMFQSQKKLTLRNLAHLEVKIKLPCTKLVAGVQHVFDEQAQN